MFGKGGYGQHLDIAVLCRTIRICAITSKQNEVPSSFLLDPVLIQHNKAAILHTPTLK